MKQSKHAEKLGVSYEQLWNLVKTGASNSEIAQTLGCSKNTVYDCGRCVFELGDIF